MKSRPLSRSSRRQEELAALFPVQTSSIHEKRLLRYLRFCPEVLHAAYVQQLKKNIESLKHSPGRSKAAKSIRIAIYGDIEEINKNLPWDLWEDLPYCKEEWESWKLEQHHSYIGRCSTILTEISLWV